jgi:hypothetical protein
VDDPGQPRGERSILKSRTGVYQCESLEQGLAFEPWIKPGDKLIVADKLAESVMKAAKAASWKKLDAMSARRSCRR